jgi:hypothetical protein
MKTAGEDVFLTMIAAEITLDKQSRTIGEELSPAWGIRWLDRNFVLQKVPH